MAQNQNNDDGPAFLGVGCAFIAGWAFWHFFHQPITNAFGWLRHAELFAISKIVHDGAASPYIVGWRDYLAHHPGRELEWQDIRAATRITGHYLRYPVAALLLLMAYFCIFRTARSSYKKTYTLDTLIAAQAKVWPVISPVVKFNAAQDNARDPDSHDPLPSQLPIFAEALSPTEWLRFNRIAPYDTAEHEGSNDPLDRDAAFYAFAEQLGPRWCGALALPWHQKGLFAAFALKVARKRAEADTLLGELAMAANPKQGMSLSLSRSLQRKIMTIIRDPAVGGAAENIAAKHAYVAPALMHLLEYARERGGVLAPASFLWLRGAERALWYPLNNMGRQSFHTEAAGAIAHLNAEKAANTPLFSPKVMAAVDTLEMETHGKGRSKAVFAD
jgi:intracellular multiplication protein IcmP